MRPSTIKPVSVLIVDDSALIRSRLRALLAKHDRLRVVGQAGGVQEACELFDETNPDAVFIDLQLSDGSGIEVLRRIKQTRPSCFVIILTNLCETPFRQECHRRGADHFLHKATEFERLIPLLLDHPDGWPARPREQPTAADLQHTPAAPSSEKRQRSDLTDAGSVPSDKRTTSRL